MKTNLSPLALTLMAASWVMGPGQARAATNGDFVVITNFMPADASGNRVTSGIAGGLAFDGTNLWLTTRVEFGQGTNRVHRINPQTQAITQTWGLPFDPGGIAWDGALLWIVDYLGFRVVGYDRDGNPQRTNVVRAYSTAFEGLTWDGTNLWGSDGPFLIKFSGTGEPEVVHASVLFGDSGALAWDGTHLWALSEQRVRRVDPVTGNVTDAWAISHPHKIAIGRNGIGEKQLWVSSGPTISELQFPAPAPLPPPRTNMWGVFPLVDDGFALPRHDQLFVGSGLGAAGTQFYYSDYFTITGLEWSDPTHNTAKFNFQWLCGAGDVASDGERIWIVSQPGRVYQLVPDSEGRSCVGVGVFSVLWGLSDGIAWDGEALWVAGRVVRSSANYDALARYDLSGRLLARFEFPFRTFSFAGNEDLTWHRGDLWVLGDYPGTITRVDPRSGHLLGSYETGGVPSNQGGIASDGTNLYATVGSSIARLALPLDLEPPRIVSASAATGQVTITFSEPLQASVSWNYSVESPTGSPMDRSSDYSFHQTMYTISGLSLVNGQPVRVTVHGVRDLTGNFIREDCADNSAVVLVNGPSIVTARPVVSITSPTNGQAFLGPLDIAISADAADSDGTVASVDFYASGQFLGTATQSPYRIIWSNVVPGTYTLMARVSDNQGVCANSAPVAIRVVPLNDDFVNRIPLSGSNVMVSGSNVTATREPGELRHDLGYPYRDFYGERSVWFSWTAPSSGPFYIGTPRTEFSTILAVYTNSALTNLHRFCAAWAGIPCALALDAIAGTTYEISVDSYYGATGNFNLSIVPPPINDHFTNAIVLTNGSTTVTGWNLGAGRESGESTDVYDTVWWCWAAPASGTVTITTAGSDLRTVLDVYTGSALSNLVRIASARGGPNLGVRVRFQAVEGATYYIRVGGDVFQAAGHITLSINPLVRLLPLLPFTANGQFRFRLTGEPGRRYRIEASRFLTDDWVSLGTQTATAGRFDAVGHFDLVDTSAPNFSQRFYRTVEP